MADDPTLSAFALFTEVGIINQLATAVLEDCLPDSLIAPHFAALNHLIRVGDGQTPLEIARALQVPKASFTNTLSNLQKMGLVETRPHPSDRRSKQVHITQEGRRLVEDTVAALAPRFAKMLMPLEPGALEALTPRLRALRRVMDDNRDT